MERKITGKLWECRECDSIYSIRREAIKCCADSVELKQWECGSGDCLKLHDTEVEADECCATEKVRRKEQ